jgi:hypothetical protein
VYTERVRGKKKKSRARRSLALAAASLSWRGRGLSKKGSRQDGEREIARDFLVLFPSFFWLLFLERVFITSHLFSLLRVGEGEEGGGDESKAGRKISAFFVLFLLFCLNSA